MTEQWKPIPGYGGKYEVSSLGNVRSWSHMKRGDLLSQWARKSDGRLAVHLYEGSQSTIRTVHQLVAEVFHGPRPEGQQVRHLDGNHLNNRADNLAYGTLSDNMRDAVGHGSHVEIRKTHCPQGHAYDEANTHVTKRGWRQCLTCKRDRMRRVRAGGAR